METGTSSLLAAIRRKYSDPRENQVASAASILHDSNTSSLTDCTHGISSVLVMRCAQHKLNQVVHIRQCPISHCTKLLRRKIQTVNPNRRITESFGAVRVPAAKGGKDNLVLSKMKCLHSEFVSARIGLKGAVNSRAQELVKQICNPALSAFARSIVRLKFAIVIIRTPAAFNFFSAATASGQGFKVK